MERKRAKMSAAEEEEIRTISKTLTASFEIESNNIKKILEKKPEKTAEAQVLDHYKTFIDKYDENQRVEWANWSGRLPKRIVTVTNLLVEMAKKAKNWQYLNYLFIFFAAAVPVIVSVLTEVYKLPMLRQHWTWCFQLQWE